MNPEILQATSTLAAALAALAAVLSGICAFLTFKLAKKIQEELASDERILAGTPIHPGLREYAHDQCVIRCTLFNKSKRKVHIESLEAYDQGGNKLEVTWASEIDHLGAPKNPFQIIGIVDSSELYVRKNDGERIEYMRLKVVHSFPDSPTSIIFDPYVV